MIGKVLVLIHAIINLHSEQPEILQNTISKALRNKRMAFDTLYEAAKLIEQLVAIRKSVTVDMSYRALAQNKYYVEELNDENLVNIVFVVCPDCEIKILHI